MPSGRTHDRITLWSLPVVAGLTLERTRSSQLTLLVSAGFLLGGLLLGPDLDIHSIHYKRWGWFRWIWIPYRGSMRHRSVLSHGPITGTVLRVAYLLTWVALLGLLGVALSNELGQLGWTWGELLGVLRQFLWQHRVGAIAIIAGLELGALSHYTADWGISTYKRVKKKGWQALLPHRPGKSRRSRRGRSTSKRKP